MTTFNKPPLILFKKKMYGEKTKPKMRYQIFIKCKHLI